MIQQFYSKVYAHEKLKYISIQNLVPMFTAALFLRPKCPLLGEWICKLWEIHTMKCQSAKQGSRLLIHAATQMILEKDQKRPHVI
jgi:small neutral amino acid transporter SnatA (MarC family)